MTTVTEAVERAAAQPTPKEVLRTLLDRNSAAVGQSLPGGFDRDRFIRLLLTAANTNPELFECDPRSFLAAGVACAQLGLEPNDPRGLAYLVPFRSHGRKVVQLIIGYRGMIDLARRSGKVTTIHAFPVFEGDQFDYELGLDPTLRHIPHPDSSDDPSKLIYVYAVAAIGGDKQFVVLSRRQIDRVRDEFARGTTSPWRTYYVEMALKTAIRRLCKLLPQTVEIAHAESVEDHGLVIGELAMPGTVEGQQFDEHDEAIDVETADVVPSAGETSSEGEGDEAEGAPGDVSLVEPAGTPEPPSRGRRLSSPSLATSTAAADETSPSG